MGGRIDNNVNKGGGPHIFRLNGQNYHLMGSLLPEEGSAPHFAQLYIYNTANELQNCINAVRGCGEQTDIHVEIVKVIKEELDKHNILVKSFRIAKTEIERNPRAEVKIKLLGKRKQDAKTYNLPEVSEVAALIVGDVDTNIGEHGYREDIGFTIKKTAIPSGRQRISPREFFCYRIHSRSSELSTLLHAKRLFQRFLVDGYTMVEAGRIIYIRTHQKSLRCQSYGSLTDALTRGEVDPSTQGRRIILPSSFTGGVRWIGYRNLFITFTCNPKWPEVQRIFKMKLDALIIECRKKQIIRNSYSIILAEIPDKSSDPTYFNAVEEFMIHGPYGASRKSSPCMVNGSCSKHFPKKFVNCSTFDEDGYPIYTRRDNGRTIMKNGITLDNMYVVPHNRHLLLKYKAHINVEWCNQSRSIKYQFKYVNKGHDYVTAEFYKTSDEEESTKLRSPSVERLSFHLPNQQSVIFEDDDAVDNIVNRPTIAQSTFMEWFEANKNFVDTRKLTYVEMPTKFVWKKDVRK
ncbi:uncharacterized protein LOC116022466 [Ipomoea triloba]|uniref:uncharacterized protein LOC116022466 n=1 Tax=Ipomoea triloba TaxID=35885 RepID=UPI00125E3EAA|nr:uncharacterized protein LOC116022466 [Ipomoea triloba]